MAFTISTEAESLCRSVSREIVNAVFTVPEKVYTALVKNYEFIKPMKVFTIDFRVKRRKSDFPRKLSDKRSIFSFRAMPAVVIQNKSTRVRSEKFFFFSYEILHSCSKRFRGSRTSSMDILQ
jgi:hypothetical protein